MLAHYSCSPPCLFGCSAAGCLRPVGTWSNEGSGCSRLGCRTVVCRTAVQCIGLAWLYAGGGQGGTPLVSKTCSSIAWQVLFPHRECGLVRAQAGGGAGEPGRGLAPLCARDVHLGAQLGAGGAAPATHAHPGGGIHLLHAHDAGGHWGRLWFWWWRGRGCPGHLQCGEGACDQGGQECQEQGEKCTTADCPAAWLRAAQLS